MTPLRTICPLFLSLLLACGSTGDGGGDGFAGVADGGAFGDAGGGGGGNIGLGGAGDFGYFRRLLDDGVVPTTDDFDAAGFFHEHFLPLPAPSCGEQVCVQAMLGAMPGLTDEQAFSMLHIGLNTPVTIDPDDRPPLTLSVVVDVSGSMQEAGKIGFVRQGLATLIDNMADTDELAIVTYSSEASVVAPLGPVGGRRATLHAIARGLTADGSTNFYDGLQLGYQVLSAELDLSRQNRVLMLSDGQPTEGNTSSEAIVSMSASFNSEGLGITTIGLGTSFNALLMRSLAEQGHGNHYFLEDSGAIDEVFGEELSYFAIPVAFDVDIDVAAGSHYDFGTAYGSSFWTDTATGGGLEVPSVYIAHRESDGDVNPNDGGTPGRRGGGSALLLRLLPKSPVPPPTGNDSVVAVLDVSFRPPGATDPVTDQITVTHPHWQDPPPAGFFGSPEPDNTAKVLVMLELYRAIERACSQYHEGAGTAALIAVARARALAADFNEQAADVDIQFDIELLDQLAQVLQDSGAVPPDDYGIPADPWPVN